MKVRRALACLASIAIGVRMYILIPHSSNTAEWLFRATTIAIPLVAGALIWIDRLTAQLLARGAWWSMLLFSALMAMTADSEASIGVLAACCAGGALVAAGSTGLASRGRFAPVAFRGTLLVSLVLAIADTGALTWYGAGRATFEHYYWTACLVVPMAIGVIGLVRLRTWGLIVNALANVAIVVLVGTRTVVLPSPLRELFMGSATIQLLVPLPMLIAMVRGRAPNPESWRRAKTIAPVVIVVAIVAFSAFAAFACHGRLLRF
ncbi:MAG TPA: hypothetical protein VGG74_38185 [Kofleriaceae bacterium]|jgi:hypothetical protein